jgi:2-polyprenyl-3-methyl-5-hydroxy-6-metoxy-1,4-benzoquinol methylase
MGFSNQHEGSSAHLRNTNCQSLDENADATVNTNRKSNQNDQRPHRNPNSLTENDYAKPQTNRNLDLNHTHARIPGGHMVYGSDNRSDDYIANHRNPDSLTYNKSLHPDDLTRFPAQVALYESLRSRVSASIQHPWRVWEWALALSALQESGCKTVLEVGSGGSLFAPMAAESGLEVTVIDPAENVILANAQSLQLGKSITWLQQDLRQFSAAPGSFDAVVCLSVLEHIDHDHDFFRRLLQLAKNLLVVTVDFSLTGRTFCPYHLRTYSPSMLRDLAHMGKRRWRLWGDPAWVDNGDHVNGYNFASLVLRRSQRQTTINRTLK